ncbi:Adenylyl cyclase-associated protein 1 [Taenia crassiceps]|uniref:Adenylyl cyclase-associated protein 1 n=1 Tax=Taenia crassiceps TaxID=6207 RepID=A0ABR4QQ07_9CEST
MRPQNTVSADRLETATIREKSIKSATKHTNNVQPIQSSIMPSLDSVVDGPLKKLSSISTKIGEDVKSQAESDFIKSSSGMAKPSSSQLPVVLRPCSDAIQKVTEFKDRNRKSAAFNHLSAVAESVAALGWIATPDSPAKFIEEMVESGKFYTNRILKEFKGKDDNHVEWVRALLDVWNELKNFTVAHYPAGLTWGSSSGASSVPPPPPPPPPRPPVVPSSDSAGPDTQALFAEINRGDMLTRGLRKVTEDMKTHKNPELRAAAPLAAKKVAAPTIPTRPDQRKAVQPQSKLELVGNKWVVENHVGNREIVIEVKEKKETVYIFKCVDSVVHVKGKLNSIAMDSCKKTSLLFDTVISSIDIVNCHDIQVQVTGTMPTISIDKTSGCRVYLSEQAKGVNIITALSSEVNILVPKGDGDFVEHAVPEQFKSTLVSNHLETKVHVLD